MRRSLHRAACVVLLSVLSGAPAVAVICAELCTTALHHEQTEHDDSSCHGLTGSGPAMTGEPSPPDCGDHGIFSASVLASLMASRGIDLAQLDPAEAHAADALVLFPSTGHALTSFEGRASPPRPARSSLVLRI